MARISLVQAINLIVVETADGKPTQKTLELKRGVNEVEPSVLTHPYIQSHMKAGTASIVPDPMDPEDIAAAAEEIARQARAQADAAKALKAAEQQKIDDAMKAATSKPATDTAAPALKDDGPTVQQWVLAGYKASAYPPSEYASKSTPEEIAAAVDAEVAKVANEEAAQAEIARKANEEAAAKAADEANAKAEADAKAAAEAAAKVAADAAAKVAADAAVATANQTPAA